MRLSLFLVLVVATFAVLVSAEKTTTARRLKRADDLTAHEEERNILATTVSGLASGAEKFLSPALLAKLPNTFRKNPAAVNKVDDGAAGAVVAADKVADPAVIAKVEDALKKDPAALNKVDDAAAGAVDKVADPAVIAKIEDALKKNPAALNNVDDAAAGATGAATGARKIWDKLADTALSGGRLKKVDTTTTQWKTEWAKLKGNPQLAGITEAQAVKMTEAAAKEVVKNPSKWRHVKKFFEIAFGAVLTGLIVAGFNSMIS
uniref:Avh288 n=1 Tax=Phytophthora sojae TaxID=67593 RepID=G1FSM1_PHYSO|nr:Avh288 [Phytophthora sojae]